MANGRRGVSSKTILSKTQPIELASQWAEIGTPGLTHWGGYLEAAYNAELYWPSCFALYNRIRRSDPEISVVRTGYSSLARKVEIEVVKPDDPTPDDEAAAEFFESELDNQEGGITRWMDTCVSYTPFLGWSWWEAIPGLRDPEWRPPNDLDSEPDPWRSEADDGLIGIRRFALRDHSSFLNWDMGDKSGKVRGLVQMDYPNPQITIPLDKSLHVVFGDVNSPEGLTPLEAVWRLERYKYALELVQGIGFEHAAGHAKFTTTKPLTPDDHINIKKAARAILTGQEGNVLFLPEHITGDIIDVAFSAAPSLLEAIRYYGLLKLQVYNMQWVAIASTAGTGAYSAMSDASSMFLLYWNAMISSFVDQYDEQIGKRLWKWNADKFAGVTDRPYYKAKPMSKIIDLAELGTFIQTIAATLPFGDDDLIEIRKRSGFLPETLPEEEEVPAPIAPQPEGIAAEAEAEGDMEPEEEAQPAEPEIPEEKPELARFENTRALFMVHEELKRANDLVRGEEDGKRNVDN